MIQKIQDFGFEQIAKQTMELQIFNQNLHKNCHSKYGNNSDLKGTLYFMASNRVKGLSLDANCALYAISEPNFFRLLRDKQQKMFMK